MIFRDDYYALLQVDPSAEKEVIEAAYRRLALKYHPDVNSTPDAGERMRALNQAYAVLSDPLRRATYNRELRARLSNRRPVVAGPRSRSSSHFDLRVYQAALEPLQTRAAAAMRRWAGEWAESLETAIAGDTRAFKRARAAAQECLAELTDCLERWESLVPPARARRLGDLGATCLKLELALVRGTLSFAEQHDFSALEPLAGLAERIGALTRTIAAETVLVNQAAVAYRGA